MVLKAQEQNMRLIVDVDSVTIKGSVSSDAGAPGTVSVTNNQVPAGIAAVDAEGRFFHTVPLKIGLNEIAVTATDGAGDTQEQMFPVIRLITDRSEEDIRYLQTLLQTPMPQWPGAVKVGEAIVGTARLGPDTLAWFQEAVLRGSYDYTDYNRVNLAMEYLRDHLNKYGYNAQFLPSHWDMEDTGTVSRTGSYLQKVAYFQTVLPIREDYKVHLPDDIDFFLWHEANKIEESLVSVDFALGLARRRPWYSGEIYSGEA